MIKIIIMILGMIWYTYIKYAFILKSCDFIELLSGFVLYWFKKFNNNCLNNTIDVSFGKF